MLATHPEEQLNYQTDDCISALKLACKRKSVSVVQTLLNTQVSVEQQLRQTDEEGGTIMFTVCRSGSIELLELFLGRLNLQDFSVLVTTQNFSGVTLLMEAVAGGSPQIVSNVLAHQPEEQVMLQDEIGRIALQYLEVGHGSILEVLLAHNPEAQVTHLNNDGIAAIHQASVIWSATDLHELLQYFPEQQLMSGAQIPLVEVCLLEQVHRVKDLLQYCPREQVRHESMGTALKRLVAKKQEMFDHCIELLRVNHLLEEDLPYLAEGQTLEELRFQAQSLTTKSARTIGFVPVDNQGNAPDN